MSYRVEDCLWVNGSGFSYNETFDILSEFCDAAEYIKSLDDRFEYDVENEDILIKIINNDNDEVCSEAWVSSVYEAE